MIVGKRVSVFYGTDLASCLSAKGKGAIGRTAENLG
jgi:hypothetical protein